MPAIDFSKPQQLPIIHLASNQAQNAVASLINVTTTQLGSKEYTYELNLEIDYLTAYRNKSFVLNIKATKQKLPDNYLGLANISLQTPENRDWITAIQIQKTRNQEVATQINDSLILYAIESNILENLKLEETQALKALTAADKVFEEERIAFKALRGSDAKNIGITIEKADQDTATSLSTFILGVPTNQKDINNFDVTSKRQDLVYGFLKDPGSFVQKRASNLLTQKFRLNGLTNNSAFGNEFFDIQNNPIFMSLKKDLSQLTSDSKIEENEIGVVQVIEKYKTKNLKKIITIKENEIGTEDFYLVFEVKQSDTRQTVQKIQVKVPHGENVKYSQFPIKEPIVSLVSAPNATEAVFSIKQQSDFGAFVKIYKHEQYPHAVRKDAKFVLVDTLQCSVTGNQNEIIWEDSTYTPGVHTTYRITSLNAYELESAAFASIVLNNNEIKPYASSFLDVVDKPTFCKLYSTYDRSKVKGITINIEDIPWHVVSFSLYRNNLSTIEEEESVVIANNINITIDQPERNYQIDDFDLIDRNLYEYFVLFTSNDGIQRESSTTHKVIYFDTDRASGITQVGNAIITNQGNVDVTFEITTEKNAFEADLIQQALTIQGTKTEFQELLTGNSKRLSSIFQTSLYRTNADTGEIEYFGIIDSSLFVDSKFGPKNGVERVQVGSKYVYTIVTHRRDPETLFYDYEKTITNNDTNQTYSFKPAFVFHPKRIREGFIVNESWIDSQPFDLFTFGDVVDIDQVKVTIPFLPPEITELQTRIISSDKTLITWSINGDRKFIDHFIIYMVHNSVETPIGTARAFNADSRYEFVDVLDNGENGIIYYRVLPVYYDYSNGKSSLTNKIFFFD